MKSKALGTIFSVMAGILFAGVVLPVFAEGYGKQAAPAAEQVAAPEAEQAMAPAAGEAAQPAMDEAMMAKWQEASTPNENHQVLQDLVGSWNYTMKFWMSPEAAPEESSGTSDVKSIMGGRFIEQTVNGTHMGQPFEGKGTVGYDNVKQEYQSIWIDSMGTGMMTASGSYDSAAKAMTEIGSFSCPMKGGMMGYRAVTKIIDENTHTYEMYMASPDGKEFRSMEITYTRQS